MDEIQDEESNWKGGGKLDSKANAANQADSERDRATLV
jgi:hypothetical protein